MTWAKITFWLCLGLIAYAYVLYPALLFAAYVLVQVRRDLTYLLGRRQRRVQPVPDRELPAVSMIVPAHNEAEWLPAKLENLQALDYPARKLEVIFISDGSTDRTNEILCDVSMLGYKAVAFPERRGKLEALDRGVDEARHDILIQSDAATLYAPDALRKLVRHFRDPRVGAVCGSLELDGSQDSQQTEGVYWKYERMLRLMEARLGANLTASGAIYALRRQCYRRPQAGTLIEDFVLPMHARSLGFRVVYDPEAIAHDHAAASVAGEFARRVRLAVGSFRALRGLLRVRMGWITRVAFVSHKVLRWAVPFLLVLLLASNAFLLGTLGYRLFFLAQAAVYLGACLGYILQKTGRKARYALLAYYLVAMNLAFLVGLVRLCLGKDQQVWQKVS